LGLVRLVSPVVGCAQLDGVCVRVCVVLQDAVVAGQYLRDYASFAAQAKMWTENFASRAQATSQDEKVTRLVEMGFDPGNASLALLAAGGDEAAALDRLLST
jgi:ubiquitin-conjugating enzyme (huntingtin interacting protein 2)